MDREEVTFAVEKSYADSGADKTAMSLYTNGFINGSQWMKNKLTAAQQNNIVAEKSTHNTAHSEISLFELVGNYHTMSSNEFTEWMGANIGELEKIARQQNAS